MTPDPQTETSAKDHGEASSAITTLIGLVFVIGIGAGLFYAFASTTLGRISMGSIDRSTTIEVEQTATLEVWADVEITHREFSPSMAADELPHVMDYIVELSAAGQQSQTLRCNLFNALVMRTSGETNSVGQAAGRWYDGLIRGCAFAVEPGTYTVTARTVEVQPDPRVSFQKNDLVLRLDD